MSAEEESVISKIKKLVKDRKNQKNYARWIMGYTKPFIPQLFFLLLMDIGVACISTGMALVGKKMVDYASNGENVQRYIVLYVLAVLVGLVMSAASGMIGAVVYEKFAFGIRKKVYRRVLDTKWLDITRYHTGDLMTRLTSDVGAVSTGISSTIPTIIQLLVQLVVTFFTLAFFDWRLAVFSLVVVPISALSSVWLGKKIKYLQIKVQETESAYRSFLQESLANILIVKSFQTEEYSEEKLTSLRDERLHWVLRKTKMGLIASSTMSAAFQFGYVAAFVWGAVCISRKLITFGTMTVFLTLVNQVQGPIIGLAQTIPSIVSMLASAGRIIELQKLPEEERSENHIKPENIGLRIEHLSFAYSNGDPVFEDAAIEFEPGKFTAIVGRSGIGKTTLVRLIMAFTNQMYGKVEFYNSYGETETANASVRNFIAYVPQGNTLFSGTIRENICIGGLQASEEKIEEALKGASAYDFVMELPDGLNTRIGEKGYGISEGQAQRIAIARALLRHAPFLILDEATSSLDQETELQVLDGIRRWSPRPTCLLISHRLSVLKYCDKEIRIKDRKMDLVEIAHE